SLPQVTEDTYYSVEVTAVTSDGKLARGSGSIRADLDQVDPITVSGRFEEADGTPAANDTIVLRPESGDAYDFLTTTNETGAYSIDAWPDRAHSIGYYQFNVSENKSTEPRFPRDGSVDIYAATYFSSSTDYTFSDSVPNGSVLDVTIVDENQTPVKNASVRYRHHNGEAYTDWYELTNDAGKVASSSDGTGLEVTGNVTIEVEPPENSTRFANTTITENVTVTDDTSFNITLPNGTSDTTTPSVDITQYEVVEDNGTVMVELSADDQLENITVEATNTSTGAVVNELNRSNFTASQTSSGVTYRANISSLDDGQYNVTLVDADGFDAPVNGLPLTRTVDVTRPIEGVSLTLVPRVASGDVRSNLTVALVADGFDDGVGTFEVNTSIANSSIASIESVNVTGSPEGSDIQYGPNGSSVNVAAFGMDTNQTGPVTIAEFTVRIESEGSTELTLSDPVVGSENASQYNLSSVGDTSISGANVTPVGDFTSPPADIDGDGQYMDINGDGEVTVSDVQAMFTHRESDVFENNVDKFDYTGNGEVNIVDIQRLFVTASA
ncbi:dockerin type I domain-containing protein, partial [Haloferax profundi]|uniref:dockerin type I domain-containing protein n=1 Tax=Haloferax profundi TaxID=1544718 RepID=UPI000AA5CB96